MGFNGKTVSRFETKKRTKTFFSTFQEKQWSTWPLNTAIKYDPCNQAELNGRKFEKKTFRLKLLEHLQD